MNIGSIANEKKTDDTAVEIEIYDRNGDPYVGKDGKPSAFFIVGEYSQQYRDNERQIGDEARALSRKGVRGPKAREEASRLAALKTAGGITGWRNVEADDGKPVPFSRDNAARILQEAPWIADQVQRGIEEHSRFFAKRSTS